MAAGAKKLPSNAEELKWIKKLGQGAFGEVWKCKSLLPVETPDANAKYVAVKKVPKSIVKQCNLLDQLDREINIMKSLKHPYIVDLLFTFKDSTHVYIGMEFADTGCMFDLMTKRGYFGHEIAARLFYELCDALEYIHGLPEKVIHRDIKPENILLDKDGHAKLADFGWSNALRSATHTTTYCGTSDYLAPEMLMGMGHNECLDMWEMGVLLYEMTMGYPPFGSSTQEKTAQRIMKVQLSFPEGIDPDLKNLILSLCKLRPLERLTAAQAKKHPYVTKFFPNPKTPPTQNMTTDVAENEEPLGRPSVEARHLKRQKEILEGELLQILQAKSTTEQDLYKVSEQVHTAHQILNQEQLKREAAEKENTRLKQEEQRQMRELQELQQRSEQLAAEIESCRNAGR